MATIINASTSNGLIQTADTSGTLQLQSGGTTKFTVDSTGAYGQLQSGTSQASTSGTSIDFTSIPSWVKRITVMFTGVSTSSTSPPQMQLGAGSVTTSGYLGSNTVVGASNSSVSAIFTTGFGIGVNTGNWSTANLLNGSITFTLLTGNTWTASGMTSLSNASATFFTSGSIVLGGTLDRVRITTLNGTDTFDAGSINILYE